MIQHVQKMIQCYIMRLQKIIQLRSMMKMYNDVLKIPMTYRDSPVNCTVLVAVDTVVEYLPS